MQNFKKYKPYPLVHLAHREWANNIITKAPIWVSTDLRDGNQALIEPMNVAQKLVYFQKLVEMGFKEIEIAYPSASKAEFDFCRALIEQDLIPEDVRVGVIVPSIEKHIKRTFEAMKGAKKIIMHLYNPTADNQRKVVFNKSKAEIITLAVEGTRIIKEAAEKFEGDVMFQYSPESFSQTELVFARDIVNAVISEWMPTKSAPMIVNLPNTLEACTPNIYADRIEWMSKQLIDREAIILSVHPHNDRGCAVASAEMAILAGAQRVEGTLLGNGERAGNVDLVILAFNLYSQGIDPMLDIHNIDALLQEIIALTHSRIADRHPYVGSMIYTSCSGTHQDAIKKGMEYQKDVLDGYWHVPYLIIDPKDIKRDYRDVVRINSQSGKSGVAYVLKEFYGIETTKSMQVEIALEVQKLCDEKGIEVNSEEIFKVFRQISKL
ncbi:MAG: 2-isopropylmalate synthase [Sulfurospirillaceae bacterium]|nr:2-isopropylmalate synthase [Sulfurospirillaceae bacterium]